MAVRKSIPFRKKLDEKASPELKYVAYLSERRIPESDLPLFAAPDEGSASDSPGSMVPTNRPSLKTRGL